MDYYLVQIYKLKFGLNAINRMTSSWFITRFMLFDATTSLELSFLIKMLQGTCGIK